MRVRSARQVIGWFVASVGGITDAGAAVDRYVRRINQRRRAMPFINVKLIEGVFSGEQKREIARKLTETMVEIEGENMRPVTWCVIEEVKSGDWAIAGKSLRTEDVKALAAGVGAR
jgi:4-oxalocrotonate tautomerase